MIVECLKRSKFVPGARLEKLVHMESRDFIKKMGKGQQNVAEIENGSII